MKYKIVKCLFAFGFGLWTAFAILSTNFFEFFKSLFFAIACLVCWVIWNWLCEEDNKPKDDE